MRALELTMGEHGEGGALGVDELLILLHLNPSLPLLLAPIHFLSLVLPLFFFLEREWEGEEWKSE